jgi:energy-coupling factor transporter ATP-binding protein EcfA2
MSGIPETRTLYEILPARSAASGREFARLVNLLLFHDARRCGEGLTLFDDRAGDFHGLDAFQPGAGGIAAGYQHKFYPCPLSDDHRKDIEKSLLKTRDRLQEQKSGIEKWVLVTPQDPVESATRKTGGDVTWFSGLREKYDIDFELEHWGHTQLQSLFIDTPAIGLYYYPELFLDGAARRRTIQEQRTRYDKAIRNEHGRIEFVGMSVYKQEAARNVPMEDIFIPLAVVPEGTEDDDRAEARRDPQLLLADGGRHVILGDPGSGKTTLLRFLALIGRSEPLQRRYRHRAKDADFRYEEDQRLPIVVTLRRYADALKQDDSLSLFDYIRANIAADFSIADLSPEFLAYYLESGKAILLFDGLDELPNPNFKRKVRNRVQNLADGYPGNCLIATSRIFGYDGAFRFDDKTWQHHRVARLGMAEIERFVDDWYRVRVERPKDRKDYQQSLLAILRNEEHEAIRELARNPLLLTIIVLVHRIDAVLPDERHVLYQKCTETLLNTWHTWKFHEMDRLHRAKVDRLNMQRMQAIAWWMQRRMGETEAGRQAVVTYADLHGELARHIAGEKPPNPDYAPEDIATAFIEFVQDRAGLLVEIGDRQFSFVHLTFQEYLTAGHIKTLTEPLSLREAWEQEIAPHCTDPRWREVIRLLVASYGANRSQELLVDWMLELPPDPHLSLLLGGLYLDGVAAAQMELQRVVARLLQTTISTDEQKLIADQLRMLRGCLAREGADPSNLEQAARSVAGPLGDERLSRLRVSLAASGLAPEAIWGICGTGPLKENTFITLFFGDDLAAGLMDDLAQDFERLQTINDAAFLRGPGGCFPTALGWSFLVRAGYASVEHVFKSLLACLIYSPGGGPLPLLIRYTGASSPIREIRQFSIHLPLDRDRDRDRDRARARARALDWALDRALDRARARDRARAPDWTHAGERMPILDVPGALDTSLWQTIDAIFSESKTPYLLSELRRRLWANGAVLDAVADYLTRAFDLRCNPVWGEALKVSQLTMLPDRQPLVEPAIWRSTLDAFANGTPHEQAIWMAACQLFLDGLLYTLGFYEPKNQWMHDMGYPNESIAAHRATAAKVGVSLAELAAMTRHRPDPALRIAHCIRDLAYGDESRAEDLKAMVESDDPEYHQIFVDCYWLPTEEERASEERQDRQEEAELQRGSSRPQPRRPQTGRPTSTL